MYMYAKICIFQWGMRLQVEFLLFLKKKITKKNKNKKAVAHLGFPSLLSSSNLPICELADLI